LKVANSWPSKLVVHVEGALSCGGCGSPGGAATADRTASIATIPITQVRTTG
jgi:hypothetical protein